MQTMNYQLELMVPNQYNKDITYNESILKIDQFLNFSVIAIIEKLPEKLDVGEKYILSEGDYKNYIAYLPHESKKVQYLEPQNGMVVFCLKNNSFLSYNNNKWNEATTTSNSKQYNPRIISENDVFLGIKDTYYAPALNNFLYLYLNGDALIDLTKVQTNEITFLIKQNHQKTYDLTWPNNIIWPSKKTPKITAKPNSMDLIKLYKIVESSYFLGKIIMQDYQY